MIPVFGRLFSCLSLLSLLRVAIISINLDSGTAWHWKLHCFDTGLVFRYMASSWIPFLHLASLGVFIVSSAGPRVQASTGRDIRGSHETV
jgi:hypothetical protein